MSRLINDNSPVQSSIPPKPISATAAASSSKTVVAVAGTAAMSNETTVVSSVGPTSTSALNNNAHIKTDKNTEVKNNNLAIVVSLLAGASAGALAKTTIAPLDRAKINFQIKKDIPYSFRAAVVFLQSTYRAEGFAALWRGNSATMARIVPYAAIQFTSHEQWRKVLRVDKDESTSGRRFLAGSLAGITSQSLTYPLDLARARMAVTDRYSDYKTLRHVFVRIWIDEGPRTLLRGYWATIFGVIPYAGTSFFTYETLKRKYYSMPGEKKNTALYMLFFGAIAGAIGQTSSYPLDIVRRRMQTVGVMPPSENQYKTIVSSLRVIYRDEGIKGGFFKGLSMNWIKGPIAVGISFSTYDLIKAFLQKNIISS